MVIRDQNEKAGFFSYHGILSDQEKKFIYHEKTCTDVASNNKKEIRVSRIIKLWF